METLVQITINVIALLLYDYQLSGQPMDEEPTTLLDCREPSKNLGMKVKFNIPHKLSA